MNFLLLILLLETSSSHWTASTPVENVIYHLSDGILKNVTPLHIFNLSHLRIKSIVANSLDALENVESLDLSHNPITELPAFIFSKLGNLKNLSLAHTKISSFNNTFVGLTNLEYLDLRETAIISLKRGDLFGLTKKVKIMVTQKSTHDRNGPCFQQISTGIFKAPSVLVSRSNRNPVNEEIARCPVREVDEPIFWYTLKICITDGIVESVGDADSDDNVGNCTLTIESQSSRQHDMRIRPRNEIKGFKTKWNRAKNSLFDGIDLDYNKIDDLQPELLNDLSPRITKISLRHNKLTVIKNNGLKNDHLITLDLTDNEISTIEDGAFEKLNLVSLDLQKNKLESIAFAKTLPVTIRSLFLQYNKIPKLPLDSFHGLQNLKVLDMTSNRMMNIEPGTFRNLKNLSIIQLKWNRIGELNPELFQGLHKLQIINLYGNGIERIPRNLFKRLNPPPTKFDLILDWNNIKTIEDGTFSRMNLSKLGLLGNDFNDNSIGECSFNGSHISAISLRLRHVKKFNGEWFRSVSGLERIELSFDSMTRIEKGFAKFMKNINSLTLKLPKLEILQDGALFGLSAEKNVTVYLEMKNLKVIEGGVFDDL